MTHMAEIERAKEHATDQVKSLTLQIASMELRIEQWKELRAEYARIAGIDVPRAEPVRLRKEA